jgi:uncharacterized protein
MPPRGPWVMRQVWHDLLFAHWPVDPARLQARVAPPLRLETFDGRAWLAITPFWMSGVRPRGVPPLPWLSTFPELNVRTYVSVDGRPGVYFLSLDAGNRIAVEVARRLFRLPYLHARMRVAPTTGEIRYAHRRVDRRAPPAELVATYRPTGPVFYAAPGSLEHWLVERYCLYTAVGGRVLRVDIDHPPWPLQPAAAVFDRGQNSLAAAHGIELPPVAPLLHFARFQDVRVWRPVWQ